MLLSFLAAVSSLFAVIAVAASIRKEREAVQKEIRSASIQIGRGSSIPDAPPIIKAQCAVVASCQRKAAAWRMRSSTLAEETALLRSMLRSLPEPAPHESEPQ